MTDRPNHSTRIDALSARLREEKVDLYLQPIADEFQGEYVPESAARLQYLTGFTGSAGLGAFWADASNHLHTLFTDGRYTLQSERELEGTGVQALNSGEVNLAKWLEQERAGRITIGIDPWIITHAQLNAWKKLTAPLDITWVELSQNPVDAIWADRPALPAGEVQLHPESLSGQSYNDKREALKKIIASHKAEGVVLTLPDGINWLLNIRGSDIPFNPLLLSYFALTRDGHGTLFCFDRMFSQDVEKYFKSLNIKVELIGHSFSGKSSLKGKWLIDPAVSPQGFWSRAENEGFEIIATDDPTLLPKACKNAVELEGIRAAHKRDGAALSKFLSWFDGQVSGGRLPDELMVVEQLESTRARDNRYRGASFATIAGAGPNGAIVHYRATKESNRRANKGDLFLLDSGGQYEDGTTDVTRTMAVGGASPRMCEAFTRVLRGHIALARVKFPEGTSGGQLDVLARQYLWDAGLDYDHGTGHGVGAFLCVHEGPQRISKKGSAVALQPGMILSNEPGYYEAGQFGIRIENLVAVIEAGKMASGKKLLGFETLTLAPIDTRLVMVDQMTSTERNWLNDYHQRVYKALESGMDAREKMWLVQATRAV